LLDLLFYEKLTVRVLRLLTEDSFPDRVSSRSPLFLFQVVMRRFGANEDTCMQDKRLVRIDPTQLGLRATKPFPVRIFANDQVAIESAAVSELLSVLDSQSTLDRLRGRPGELSGIDWAIEQTAVTPDFHKGAGTPIGTVLKTKGVVFPQAIGNDINCGMRLHSTSLDATSVSGHLDALESAARHLFFEGGRQIPMTGRDREALLIDGLSGLFGLVPWERLGGQWQTIMRFRWHEQLDRIERQGSLPAKTAADFADWIGATSAVTYDDQIGSVGGGNHFVEIQRVEHILDRQTAFAWGLKKGAVTIMIHSGSVGIGHIAGRSVRELLNANFPRSCPHPSNGIYPLNAQSGDANRFWDLVNNAANFAFANRLFLATSAVEALERIVGAFEAPLLYDSPHNLVWQTADGGFLHRKGATSARGPEDMEGTPFHYWGEPVLVPGSMGSSSFVLAGIGNRDALDSASHGAGRALSRGEASRTGHACFDEFLRDFRVVMPLDLRRPDVRGRADIPKRKIDELRAEGPHAYKGIRAIIDTLTAAKIARPVAELVPLMTIKG
jgi:tRNA-splicing ligase RtcB